MQQAKYTFKDEHGNTGEVHEGYEWAVWRTDDPSHIIVTTDRREGLDPLATVERVSDLVAATFG